MAEFRGVLVAADIDEAKLQERYEAALSQAAAFAGGDLRSDVALGIVSFITSEILTQVAVQIGVSAGMLGSGAAASGPTLGISLVLSLIVDEIISWVWDWYADPSGTLVDRLNEKLDGINRVIVEGSKSRPGLRSWLGDYSRQRAKARAAAVMSVLQSSEGANR
jgi:hypothetical protein